MIDWEGTFQACHNKKADLNELLDLFVDDFPKTEQIVESAYRNNEMKTLALQLHYCISFFYSMYFM